MLHIVILILVLSTTSNLVSSLQCYSCDRPLLLDYLVTSDTVPSFSDCPLINTTECWISVTWDLNLNGTIIIVDDGNTRSMKDAAEDSIVPMAFMAVAHDQETPQVIHSFQYFCTSWDKCNNETNLKQILHSLVIEEKFAQELIPLIHVVSPFNPRSAACIEFNNYTNYCPPTDLSTCPRCQILADKWSSSSQDFCATCPSLSLSSNVVLRSTTFMLNNRTQLADKALLDCQLKGCNSIDNINRIYKASKITFNFDTYANSSKTL